MRQKRITNRLKCDEVGSSHHNPARRRPVDDYKFPVDFTERSPALSESRVSMSLVSIRHRSPQTFFSQSVKPNQTCENMCSIRAGLNLDNLVRRNEKGQPDRLTLL